MDISNPKRILAICLESEKLILSEAIKDLTGTYPEPHPGTSSLAGTTHSLTLNTSYYKAEVPIWIDLVASPSEWATSFTSPEAKEVLDVLGGVVVIFSVSGAEKSSSSSINTSHISASNTGEHAPSTSPTELIREMGRVMGSLGGWDWNGVGLGIGIGGSSGTADMFDDACAAIGLEFVHATTANTASGNEGEKNEFGEKIGMERALEALQANDWNLGSLSSSAMDEDEFGDFEKPCEGKAKSTLNEKEHRKQEEEEEEKEEFDPENLDFGFDRRDFEGLKKAIWNAGNDEAEDDIGDEDVQKIERMMHKLQAVRDMSAGLPEDQRKRMAKNTVSEVMKEL